MMPIALDPRDLKEIRLSDVQIGSVIGPVPSNSTYGIVLKHADPNKASRFVLMRDASGVGILHGHVPHIVRFAEHTSIRVLIGGPAEVPENLDAAIGLLGIDGHGPFAIVDSRRQGANLEAGVAICLRDWSYNPDATGNRSRARDATFFKDWRIIVVDEFGSRWPIVSSGIHEGEL